MNREGSQDVRALSEDAALRTILEGTATETGERFFGALVRHLAGALGTHGAWVTEYFPETRRLRALAFWLGDRFVEWEGPIDGTPCEAVVTERRRVHIPDRVFDLYPGGPDFRATGACSYMGVPLQDLDGTILGHLAVLDTRPMAEEPSRLAMFRIFADRAGAELRRLRAEKDVREREVKLARLVDSAMDAILELDKERRVTRFNPAAARIFEWEGNRTPPGDFDRLGMTHPNFLATLEFLDPALRAKAESVAPLFS